jgi:hypothetical protein
MLWTILGLSITLIVSLEGTLHSDRSRRWKSFLVVLAFGGFAVAGYMANLQNQAARAARQAESKSREQLEETTKKLADAKQSLDQLVAVAGFTEPVILGKLGEDEKFYVRVAADTDPERLKPHLTVIKRRLGASAGDVVTIRKPRPGSDLYELTFGNDLVLPAAQVFYTVAERYHFQPAGQRPVILREPKQT